MTMTDAGLMPLVLRLGRTRAAGLDVRGLLESVCAALPEALGVAGAAILAGEHLGASDDRARWIAGTQVRAGRGPLPDAVRTGRALLTADLTRIGPPALAAAAAEAGLVASLVVPLEAGAQRVGSLQLLGGYDRPLDPGLADAVRPLAETLAARLADVAALREAAPVSSRPASALTPARAPGPAPTSASAQSVPAPGSPTRPGSVPAPPASPHRPSAEPVRPAPGPPDVTRTVPASTVRPRPIATPGVMPAQRGVDRMQADAPDADPPTNGLPVAADEDPLTRALPVQRESDAARHRAPDRPTPTPRPRSGPHTG